MRNEEVCASDNSHSTPKGRHDEKKLESEGVWASWDAGTLLMESKNLAQATELPVPLAFNLPSLPVSGALSTRSSCGLYSLHYFFSSSGLNEGWPKQRGVLLCTKTTATPSLGGKIAQLRPRTVAKRQNTKQLPCLPPNKAMIKRWRTGHRSTFRCQLE